MEQTAFAALERYGVLGVAAALLIAAFIWYQRTQDKFRDEEKVNTATLRAELRELKEETRSLRTEVKTLTDEVRDTQAREEEWKAKYYALLHTRHPRHEGGLDDEPVGT